MISTDEIWYLNNEESYKCAKYIKKNHIKTRVSTQIWIPLVWVRVGSNISQLWLVYRISSHANYLDVLLVKFCSFKGKLTSLQLYSQLQWINKPNVSRKVDFWAQKSGGFLVSASFTFPHFLYLLLPPLWLAPLAASLPALTYSFHHLSLLSTSWSTQTTLFSCYLVHM